MRLRMLLVLPALLLASLVPALTSGSADAASLRTWDRLAACESGGRWHIATGNGFYGGNSMVSPNSCQRYRRGPRVTTS